MWDAAYVPGALSSVERRGFETHLADCPLCPSAIGELERHAGLLSQLDRDDLAAMAAADRSGAPLVAYQLLPMLLAKANWRRRRSRIVTWAAGTAAAAVLAIGVCIGAHGQFSTSVPAPPQASVSIEPMAQVEGTTKLASTVSLSSQHSGNVHLDELRLPGPAERQSRQAGDGRGGSRR